jgi:C-terminal region of Mon2 protein
LFPLLDKVKKYSSQASDRRDDGRSGSSGSGGTASGNILMHHSRDTAEKQWAETRFLTLAGVARVFSSKRQTLQQLGKKFHLSFTSFFTY